MWSAGDTDVVHVVVVVRLVDRRCNPLRWRLDEHDVSVLHHSVCCCVVDAVCLGVPAVPAEPALPKPTLQLIDVRIDVYESPGADGPEVLQRLFLPLKDLVRGPQVGVQMRCRVRQVRHGEYRLSPQEFGSPLSTSSHSVIPARVLPSHLFPGMC